MRRRQLLGGTVIALAVASLFPIIPGTDPAQASGTDLTKPDEAATLVPAADQGYGFQPGTTQPDFPRLTFSGTARDTDACTACTPSADVTRVEFAVRNNDTNFYFNGNCADQSCSASTTSHTYFMATISGACTQPATACAKSWSFDSGLGTHLSSPQPAGTSSGNVAWAPGKTLPVGEYRLIVRVTDAGVPGNQTVTRATGDPPKSVRFTASDSRPGFLTLLLGRSQHMQYTSSDCTTGSLSSGTDGQGNAFGMKTMSEVVSTIRDNYNVSMVGGVVNSPTFVGQAEGEASVRKCNGGLQSASWTDLQALRDTKGLKVTSYGNDYNQDMSTAYPVTNSQARYDATCGSLSRPGSFNDFNDWGFPEARGMYMWPSNQKNNPNDADVDDWTSKLTRTGWADVTPANSPCFSFARLYAQGRTFFKTQPKGKQLTPPLLGAEYNYVKTRSAGGGVCFNGASNCGASTQAFGSLAYENIDVLKSLVKVYPSQYTILQAYRFVTGKRVDGAGAHWDCSAAVRGPGSNPDNWKLHWSTSGEILCWEDLLSVVEAIPVNFTVVTDPLTVAKAWGQPVQ